MTFTHITHTAHVIFNSDNTSHQGHRNRRTDTYIQVQRNKVQKRYGLVEGQDLDE